MTCSVGYYWPAGQRGAFDGTLRSGTSQTCIPRSTGGMRIPVFWKSRAINMSSKRRSNTNHKRKHMSNAKEDSERTSTNANTNGSPDSQKGTARHRPEGRKFVSPSGVFKLEVLSLESILHDTSSPPSPRTHFCLSMGCQSLERVSWRMTSQLRLPLVGTSPGSASRMHEAPW